MKNVYILTVAVALGTPIAANAADCILATCLGTVPTHNLGGNCQTSTTLGCVSGIKYTGCATCPSGYSKETDTYTDTDSGCSITYTKCTNNSTGTCCSSSCFGLPRYEATDTDGYERQSTRTCNETTCQCEYQPTNTYRCATGYYGTALTQISMTGGPTTLTGCEECPKYIAYMGVRIPTTSQPGNNSNVSDCYVPAHTQIKDPFGTYEYVEDCHYTE